MITITQTRRKDGEMFGPDVSRHTVPDAFERFVVYELGYGGQVIDLDYQPDDGGTGFVKIETRVLGCLDHMTLVGTNKEMQLICAVAAMSHEHHGYAKGSIERTTDAVMQLTQGNPLLIKMGADWIAGQHTIRNICLALVGGSSYADRAAKIPMKDLLAAILMVHEKEATLDEAMELALATVKFDNAGRACGLKAA